MSTSWSTVAPWRYRPKKDRSVVALCAVLVSCVSIITCDARLTQHSTVRLRVRCQVFSDKLCDCLRAKCSWENATALLESFVDEDSGLIVSSVSLASSWEGRQGVRLSYLQVPSDDVKDLVIEDISKLITAAAQNMSVTISKSVTKELVPMYGAIFHELHRQTKSWPFTQARVAIFYHFSIVHAAQRLNEGVSLNGACPPYDGYATGKVGLFVCRQEYHDVFRRAVQESNSLKVTDGNLEDLVEDVARLTACGSFDCSVSGCSGFQYDLGWHILGSDTGCCGDYSSCCDFASSFCFFHDIICRCCSYFICPEPYCKPDAGCPNTTLS